MHAWDRNNLSVPKDARVMMKMVAAATTDLTLLGWKVEVDTGLEVSVTLWVRGAGGPDHAFTRWRELSDFIEAARKSTWKRWPAEPESCPCSVCVFRAQQV